MDSSLKISLKEIKLVILKTIRANKSSTLRTLLNALKSNYPNVNTVHLRYKLNIAIRKLKNEKVVREIKKNKTDFGQNVNHWSQNISLLDLYIIQCLKVLDQLLSKEM